MTVRTLLGLLLIFASASAAQADAVTDWNLIATAAGAATGLKGMPQTRAYAMTHAAIHDALNAISRRYRPYIYDATAPSNASPDAAVATAAHDVLIVVFPNQKNNLDSTYQNYISNLPQGN